jgi:hypothetical protein
MGHQLRGDLFACDLRQSPPFKISRVEWILLPDNLLDLDPLFLQFAFEPLLPGSALVISLKKLRAVYQTLEHMCIKDSVRVIPLNELPDFQVHPPGL